MKSRRLGLFFVLLVLAIPLASAEISITLPQKDVYSLGEGITPEVSVKESQDYNGFFKLNIRCDDYDMQYFAIPLSVEADSRRVVEAPELTLFQHMVGSCRIEAAFDGNDGSNIAKESSDEFEVSDSVKITTQETVDVQPGEVVSIIADISKASGEALTGNAEIIFNSQTINSEISSGRLDQIVTIPPDMESGEKLLVIRASDEFGNLGEVMVTLNVLQIPTSIENAITSDVLIPGEELKAVITLYDHIGTVIGGSGISVKVFGPDEKQLSEELVESGNGFSLMTHNGMGPGAYYLLSSFENVRQQSIFTITELRKITMRQEGMLVYVENAGNVDYNDKATILLEAEGGNYIVNKKLELKPGEVMAIDLSKEVPSGTYDITLPEEAFQSTANESAEIFGPPNLIKDVKIEDSRSLAKKSVDGISSVTGAAISTAKIVASKPTLASMILITIILGITAYYSKGFIIGRIRKKDDSSKLFKDFKYSKEEEKK